MEATNATLSSQVVELKVELALKDEKIHEPKNHQTESLDRIEELVGNLGDVLNKAHLFDSNIKTEGQLSAAKIISILVNFGYKMETTLMEV